MWDGRAYTRKHLENNWMTSLGSDGPIRLMRLGRSLVEAQVHSDAALAGSTNREMRILKGCPQARTAAVLQSP